MPESSVILPDAKSELSKMPEKRKHSDSSKLPDAKSDLSMDSMVAADADDFVEPPTKKKSHLKIAETTDTLVMR